MLPQTNSCSMMLMTSADELVHSATVRIKDPVAREQYRGYVTALVALLRRAADNADLTDAQQHAATEGFASFIYNISKHSHNTLRQMKHAFTRYLDWCEDQGHYALPSNKFILVRYLGYLETNCGLVPTTISSHLAFVALLIRSAELVDETKTKIVTDAVANIRVNAMRNGFMEGQESPFRRHHLDALKLLWGNSENIREQRDLALLSLSWESMLRESELVSLKLASFNPHRTTGGYTGTLPFSKTAGKKGSAEPGLFYISKETYQRLVNVIELTGGDPQNRTSYIFYPLTKAGKKNKRFCDKDGQPNKPMSGESVDKIFDRAYKALLPDDVHKAWRGHSARIGRAQDLSEEDATNKQIMMLGRWKDPKMPSRYTRSQELGDIANKFL